MFIEDVKCPFKTFKSKTIKKEGNEVCITEQIDFGRCDTKCIYCVSYADSNFQLHLMKCKRIDK